MKLRNLLFFIKKLILFAYLQAVLIPAHALGYQHEFDQDYQQQTQAYHHQLFISDELKHSHFSTDTTPTDSNVFTEKQANTHSPETCPPRGIFQGGTPTVCPIGLGGGLGGHNTACWQYPSTHKDGVLNHFDRLEGSPDKVDAAQIIRQQLQEVHEKKGHAFTAPLGTMLTLYNQMQQLGQGIDELSADGEQQSKAAAENTEEQQATSAATNTRAKNPKANQAETANKPDAGFNPIKMLVESTPLLNIAGTIFKAVADSLNASESNTAAENPQEGLQTEAGANTQSTETRPPRGGTQAGTFEGASTGTSTDSGAGSGAGSGFANQPPVSGNTSSAGGGLSGLGGTSDPTPAAEFVSQAFTPATQPSTLSSAELGSNGRGVFTGMPPDNNEQNDRQTRTTPIPTRKPDFGPRGVSNWDPDTSGWDSQQFVPQVNLSEEFSIPRTQSAQHALQPQPNFETRGRTTVRGQPAPQRNGSPPRLPDTGFEQLMQGTTNEIGNWSVAKDRLLAGEINAKNIARTAGYCALEHIASESQKPTVLGFFLVVSLIQILN